MKIPTRIPARCRVIYGAEGYLLTPVLIFDPDASVFAACPPPAIVSPSLVQGPLGTDMGGCVDDCANISRAESTSSSSSSLGICRLHCTETESQQMLGVGDGYSVQAGFNQKVSWAIRRVASVLRALLHPPVMTRTV